MEWLDSWRDSWADESNAADPSAAQGDQIELVDAREEQDDEPDDSLPTPPGLTRRNEGEQRVCVAAAYMRADQARTPTRRRDERAVIRV